MRLLIFGGSGQLGFELIKRARDLHFDVFYPVTKELDITDEIQVTNLITKLRPDVVINSAAYTLVDLAETERDRALEVNALAPAGIAKACNNAGSYFVHISTDYVFDGLGDKPYKEEDITHPINHYGESKLQGEHYVLNNCKRSAILRTSSLHGQKGVNFVHTMLKLFKEKKHVKVVSDQFMSPTWAGWLAESILDIARIKPEGVLHASGSGVCSWYEFANEILALTKDSHPDTTVDSCLATEFLRPAKRPSYSVMNCSKLEGILGRKAITWKQGLINHLTELGY